MDRIINVLVKFTAQGLTKMTAELRNLNTEMNQLRGNQANLNKQTADSTKQINKNRRAQESLANSTKKSSGAFANFGKQMANTIAFLARFALAVAAIKAVEFAFIGTAKAAAEFEAALKDLQAIANVSNEELAMMRDLTFDVAGSTRFTAQEIVELQKALARLGFTTSEVVDSTEGIARFAEATGEATGVVAEFVGKQMRAFNKTTGETLELVNAYTVAINNSALNLETLATSSQYAASISSALGVSIQEQNSLLATLSNNGLTASRAGTGLRKVLLELGAEGGSLVPILDDLSEANISVSDAEELVGDRAAGALLALVRQKDAVKDLIDEQQSLTATLLASARQNSTFEGQVKALRAAVDELVIGLGDWVSETELVLELIELLGGGTKLRGFNIIDELGLSAEELDEAVKGVSELDKSFTVLAGRTPSVVQIGDALGLSAEQMFRLESMSIKDFEAFLDVLRDQNKELQAQTEITNTVTGASENYRMEIASLAEAFSNAEGLGDAEINELYSERDALYSQISGSIDGYKTALSNVSPSEVQQRKNIEAVIAALEGLLQTTVNLGTEVASIGSGEAVFFTPEQIKSTEQAAVDMEAIIKDLFKSIDSDVDAGLLRGDEIADKINNQYFPAIEKALLEGTINLSQAEDLREAGRNLLATILSGDDGEGGISKDFLTREIQRFLTNVNQLILDATQRRLQAEQAAIDARYSYEEDRLNAFLQAGIISAQQYEAQRLRLEKERVEKTNEIERKKFNAEKANALAELAIQTAVSIISNPSAAFKISNPYDSPRVDLLREIATLGVEFPLPFRAGQALKQRVVSSL